MEFKINISKEEVFPELDIRTVNEGNLESKTRLIQIINHLDIYIKEYDFHNVSLVTLNQNDNHEILMGLPYV